MNLSFLDRSGRKVLDLPLNQIQPDPDRPRRDFQDLDRLAASITTLGLQQPLLVRKLPKGDCRIVAGERRWRAAQLAELQSLPCLILPEAQASDLGRRRAVQLTENLQRSDLSMKEIAQGLQAALEHSGVSKAQLASLLGKSRAFVHRHLALLQATGTLAETLDESRLPCTETFRLFAKLDEGEQKELLTRAREEDRPLSRGEVWGWSRRDPEEAAASMERQSAHEEITPEEDQEPAPPTQQRRTREASPSPAPEPKPDPPARSTTAKSAGADSVRLVL